MTDRVAPFGSWPSPFPIELLTRGAATFAEVGAAGGRRWWLEGRAEEGGRQVLVRRELDGTLTRLTPDGFNARCRVHEYGGGAALVAGNLVVVSDFPTGRLLRVVAPGVLEPLTPEGRAWRFADLSLDDWRRVLDVNLTGVFLCAKYAFRAMQEAGGGVILATASVAGLEGTPNLGAYGPAKAGVIQLIKTIALEGARHNIRANALCPVWTTTPLVDALVANNPERGMERLRRMVPLGRLGQPEDVANVAAFLVSDEASFLTGVAMPIDGGHTA